MIPPTNTPALQAEIQENVKWCRVRQDLLKMHPDFFTRVSKLQELSVKLGEPDVSVHDILVSILSGGLWAMEHELSKDNDEHT